LIDLLSYCLEMELFRILLGEKAAIAHVFQAFDEVLEAHAPLLLLERALDVKATTSTPSILLRIEWVFKIDRKGIVEEVRWRRRKEWWRRSHIDILQVESLEPGSVDCVEALRLLA
jgi:hypothetical protein